MDDGNGWNEKWVFEEMCGISLARSSTFLFLLQSDCQVRLLLYTTIAMLPYALLLSLGSTMLLEAMASS